MFELIFFAGAKRRPQLVQAVMLRRQDFTQKLMTLFGQLQMQTAAIVIALAAFNPAAFFQFISDTGGVGTR